MSKDYYKILGVDKNASQEDIKKAFRKLAHVHHPDKGGGDEKKFKEINEAYQVIGDPKKREQYDRYGSAFEQAQGQGGFGGFEGFRDFSNYTNGFNINMDDLGDIFGGLGDMFGFSARGGQGRRGGHRTQQRGRDIEAEIEISFMEAVFGLEKEIKLRKNVVCDKCKGNGAEPGSKVENCGVCHGTGRVIKNQRTIFGMVQMETVCHNCQGEGKIHSQKCTKCRGAGVTTEDTVLSINVPAGIDNSESIRYSGQGEAGEKGAPAGDLYIRVRVKPDSRFRREGYDIHSESQIKFTQAADGDKIEIETVDGPVELKIPEGTQSGTVFRLKERGVPKLRGRGRGDHLVRVNVKIPKGLSRKLRKALEELGEEEV